jgi:hypothetical protein
LHRLQPLPQVFKAFVSRPNPLLARTSLTALALLVTGPLLRADDPPATTPPAGSHVIYETVGGKRVPIFVKDQVDPLHAARNLENDPLDHQKVFSETNPMAHKSFTSPEAANWNQAAGTQGQDSSFTKVYNIPGDTSVYNTGSKSTYHINGYEGVKAVPGFDQSFATKSADVGQDQNAMSQFAAIGSTDQNRTAAISSTPFPTYAAPADDSSKTFQGPEEDARHRHLTRLKDGQLLIEDIPDRPLSIDEVKGLINHGFKPDTTQPPPPASKPLNDPNYQPTPLRISPAEVNDNQPDNQPAPADTGHKEKVQDDDANDPVPSPGTMAEPPENSEPLPSK